MTELRGPIVAHTFACELCGREAGQVLHNVFYQAPGGTAPVQRDGVPRCGHCQGRLVATPDAPAQYVLQRLPPPARWETGVTGRPRGRPRKSGADPVARAAGEPLVAS